MELFNNKVLKIDQPDKNLYAEIMITDVMGTDKRVIKKQEWIVRNCKKELEMEDNYTNELQQKYTRKALFWKQGDFNYGTILYGQLGSNNIAAGKNSTTPDYATAHKSQCVVSLLSIHLLIYVKNITITKVDPLYDGLQVSSATLS